MKRVIFSRLSRLSARRLRLLCRFSCSPRSSKKVWTEEDLPIVRADVTVGTLFANLIAFFIIVSTAATLNLQGVTEIDSAATAAEALAPIAGNYAKYLFAVGLFGAAMLAMGVLPLATAYSVSEALGFEKGLSRSFREAPIFLGIFTALILIGAIVALDSGNSADQTFALYAVHQRSIAPDYSGRRRFAVKQRGNYGQT